MDLGENRIGTWISGWSDPPRFPVFRIPKPLLIEFIVVSKALIFLEGYDLVLLVLGRSILAASVLPRLLFDKPLMLPRVLQHISLRLTHIV